MFTQYLQFHLKNLPFLPVLQKHSQLDISDCGIFTSMASSPIHSNLHHGIEYSSFLPKSEKPPLFGTVNDSIRPSFISISNSQGYPSLSPPHRFITSSSRSSSVLIFRTLSPPKKISRLPKMTVLIKYMLVFSFYFSFFRSLELPLLRFRKAGYMPESRDTRASRVH